MAQANQQVKDLIERLLLVNVNSVSLFGCYLVLLLRMSAVTVRERIIYIIQVEITPVPAQAECLLFYCVYT